MYADCTHVRWPKGPGNMNRPLELSYSILFGSYKHTRRPLISLIIRAAATLLIWESMTSNSYSDFLKSRQAPLFGNYISDSVYGNWSSKIQIEIDLEADFPPRTEDSEFHYEPYLADIQCNPDVSLHFRERNLKACFVQQLIQSCL